MLYDVSPMCEGFLTVEWTSPHWPLLRITQRVGEDQYIHIPQLDKSLEKFWPFAKVRSGLKRGEGILNNGMWFLSRGSPVLLGWKTKKYGIWRYSGWSGLSLYPIHFSCEPSPLSYSLGFNCFEAERSPRGAQQDVLQSFGETDY